MLVEPGTGRESVLHELRHERLGVGQGRDAVADVARRHDAQLLPQAPGRSPVVRDRYDRRDVRAVALQPAQQGGESRSSPDRHDSRPASQVALGVEHLENAVTTRHEG